LIIDIPTLIAIFFIAIRYEIAISARFRQPIIAVATAEILNRA